MDLGFDSFLVDGNSAVGICAEGEVSCETEPGAVCVQIHVYLVENKCMCAHMEAGGSPQLSYTCV